MTQQQQEQQDLTDQTLPVTHGSVAPSTSVRQWVFPHLDTPSSGHQEVVLLEEEVEEDSQEEEIPAEAAASQEDQEDTQPTLKEDTQETD